MMLRLDCLRSIYSQLENCLVVTIMGAVAAELQSLGHRPNFFYLQHAMGLASSTGLGLALCLPEQEVVVIDGDGSLLMNLGSLTTLARYRPRKLVHVVFDNESLLSVGGFPTATSTGTDLEGIARAAGIPRVATVRSVDNFKAAVTDAMQCNELTTIIAKVEAKGPAAYVTDLSLLENRFQFRRYVQSLKRG
jgi:sulfopyruvate decarboxylase subunit beta